MTKPTLLALSDKQLLVSITEADPVITFSTGNSRAKFIDLGETQNRPSRLFLRPVPPITNVYAGGGSWSPRFFSLVTFLDEAWQPIGPTQRSSTKEFPLDCPAGSGCAIGASAVEIPERARYMALHTPSDMVGVTHEVPLQDTVRDQTDMIGGAFVNIPGGGKAVARVIAMAVGEVEVTPLEGRYRLTVLSK